jgi:predicted CoA-binding protein
MRARKMIVGKMLGQNAVREIENAPLSIGMINTRRRINNMSHDVEEMLRDKLKNNSFSIQVDGSTNFTD